MQRDPTQRQQCVVREMGGGQGVMPAHTQWGHYKPGRTFHTNCTAESLTQSFCHSQGCQQLSLHGDTETSPYLETKGRVA